MASALLVCFLLVYGSRAIPVNKEIQNDAGSYPEQGDYFEGDIDMGNGRSALGVQMYYKSGILDESFRWPGGVVPYSFNNDYTEEEIDLVKEGMGTYEAKTCIRFVERTDEDDYLEITKEPQGCHSFVGHQGGSQVVNYDTAKCLAKLGTIEHELMHALGFFHEQSRPDRDDYITINWDNIREEAQKNFLKRETSEVSMFDVEYDYGSVMHYPSVSFAKNKEEPTIIPKNSDVRIGQRITMSDSDLQKIRAMYNCVEDETMAVAEETSREQKPTSSMSEIVKFLLKFT